MKLNLKLEVIFCFCKSLDVSGGYSPSMLSSIRQSVIATNVCKIQQGAAYNNIDFKELFYLATLGGSQGILSSNLGLTIYSVSFFLKIFTNPWLSFSNQALMFFPDTILYLHIRQPYIHPEVLSPH